MAGLLLQLRNLRSKEGKATLQRPQQPVPESGGNLDLVLHRKRGQVEHCVAAQLAECLPNMHRVPDLSPELQY